MKLNENFTYKNSAEKNFPVHIEYHAIQTIIQHEFLCNLTSTCIQMVSKSCTITSCIQGGVYTKTPQVNTVSVVIVYIMKTWHLHISVFTKNGTSYFWLFNSILSLSHGPRTRGSCSWMVKIGRCLPCKPPRTVARRKNTKNPSRTSCTLHWDPSLRHARSREYGMTMPITFAQVHVFAVYTSIFPGSVFKVST